MSWLQIIWIAQDVIMATTSIVLVPFIMWKVSKRVAPASHFLLVLVTVPVFASGLSHVAWDFVPPDIPVHAFATHTVSTIGMIWLGVWLLFRNRRVSDALKVSTDPMFQSAFQFARIGMAIVSTDGHWIEVNRALCDLVGYTRFELTQKNFQDMTHPDDLEMDLAYVQRMKEGDIETYEMRKRYKHKDGHYVPILLSVSAIYDADGGVELFMSQIQDESRLERQAAELREAIIKQDQLINAMTSEVTKSLIEKARGAKAKTG